MTTLGSRLIHSICSGCHVTGLQIWRPNSKLKVMWAPSGDATSFTQDSSEITLFHLCIIWGPMFVCVRLTARDRRARACISSCPPRTRSWRRCHTPVCRSSSSPSSHQTAASCSTPTTALWSPPKSAPPSWRTMVRIHYDYTPSWHNGQDTLWLHPKLTHNGHDTLWLHPKLTQWLVHYDYTQTDEIAQVHYDHNPSWHNC